MQFSAIILALMATTATAFSPFAGAKASSTKASAPSSLNGWVPDESAFCWGLPGALAPVGEFDPVGFSKDTSLSEMKRLREAEVTHGRVSMLAVVGFLVAEQCHPFFSGDMSLRVAETLEGPAIRHLDAVREVAPGLFEVLGLSIAIAETSRAQNGWVAPTTAETNRLKEDYYPGDIGFDPLGLKPADAAEYAEMQTKELQHGRVAMLAAAGFIAQELVNNISILDNLELLSKA